MIAGIVAAQRVAGGGGSDPYFASVVSLLHFNGADASTTFTDVKGKTWTPTGALIDTAQSKFGGASGESLGGQYLSAAASADWDFGTGEFTLEAWLRISASSGAGCPLINDHATSNKLLALFCDTPTSGRVLIAGANQLTGITLPTAGTWFHYALVRSGTTLTAYVDGAVAASATYASAIGGNDAITIMGSAVHPGWIGHIDEFRATKGVARYTAAFTPPSTPFPDS